ncbi:MAG: hypothetical protein MSG64_09660 [Pyrinomonadaceae bacterium MAG19_C2-C3]|nr:hypothetical protein [Pyrinomonadaceae bacterium MAG19_C2-C3]
MNYFQGRVRADGDEVCPKCGERRVRAWKDMKDDEREFVGRVFRPDEGERQRCMWCVLCWEEVRDDAPRFV